MDSYLYIYLYFNVSFTPCHTHLWGITTPSVSKDSPHSTYIIVLHAGFFINNGFSSLNASIQLWFGIPSSESKCAFHCHAMGLQWLDDKFPPLEHKKRKSFGLAWDSLLAIQVVNYSMQAITLQIGLTVL